MNYSASLPAVEAQPEKSQVALSIVIPCFNEEDTIAKTIQEVQQHLTSRYPQLSTELLLINDGSTDRTLEILNTFENADSSIRVISFPVNKGRGEALKAGILFTKGKWVIMLDADLTYDVQHVSDILAVFDTDHTVDVVVVSPYMKDGVVAGVPFNRLLLSRIANWLLGGFFVGGLSTVTCVVRGYRGELIRRIYLTESNKELHLEILRKLSIYSANIREIPGRLIWKSTKQAPRRKNNLKTVSSAQKHFMYSLMVRPTRYFKYLAIVMFAIGLYELVAIGAQVIAAMDFSLPWNEDLRQALLKSFQYSQHSYIIGTSALILAFQTFSFLVILQTIKRQQEETLRHLLALLEDKMASRS